MSNKKKVFSTLAAVTVGVIAGSAIALTPVIAFAGDDHAASDHKGCSGDKKSCSGDKKACSGDKKAAGTPGAGTPAAGDHKSCSGDKKSCSGDKKACSGEKAHGH